MQLSSRAELSRVRTTGARRWQQYMSLLPSILCALLSLWLLFMSEFGAMVLALCAMALSLVVRWRQSAPQSKVPNVSGTTRIDPTEMCRQLEHLMRDIDGLMQRDAPSAEQPMELTQGLMESIQMLMEARLQQDGEFALKALPGMVAALKQQRIDVLMYEQSGRQNFDLLPAPTGGETIRPALMKDGKLLMRGQATVKG